MSAPPAAGVVLTLGESMALLDALEAGRPVYGARFGLRVAGAESNFAIGLQRLGVPTRWISRVGGDVLGELIVEAVGGEGVDVRGVARDPARSTGIFMKWRDGSGDTSRAYFRRHSAAAALRAEDLGPDVLDDVRWLHLTGITTALSDSCAEAVVALARAASGRAVPVSFDLNYRPALWPSADAAAAVAGEVLPHVDWVLCGAEEGRDLFGSDDPATLAGALRARGAGAAVIRTGVEGAWLVEGAPQHVPIGALESDVADEVGAGDAFAAGFVAGMLGGRGALASTHVAHALAAHALRGTGDWETLPKLGELRAAQPGLL